MKNGLGCFGHLSSQNLAKKFNDSSEYAFISKKTWKVVIRTGIFQAFHAAYESILVSVTTAVYLPVIVVDFGNLWGVFWTSDKPLD